MKYRENIFYKINLYIMILLFILLIAVIMIQIVTRFMGITVAWTSELTRVLFIWLCFSSFVAGVWQNIHVGALFFVNRLSDNNKYILEILSKLAFIIFSIIMVFGGTKLTIRHFLFHRMASSMPIPMYLISFIIPISFVAITLILVNQLLLKFRGGRGKDKDKLLS